jgi:flap endonuclease-1
MGLKNLNKFLKQYCTNASIQNIHFQQLANTIIAIDASIYMYKYIEKEELVEKMHLMISVLTKQYNITPLFVFDGKPPQEKKELIDKRCEKRREAETEYNQLKQMLNQTQSIDPIHPLSSSTVSTSVEYNFTQEEKDNIEKKMGILKKQTTRIQEYHIRKMKRLLNALGIQYIDAEGEADITCAELVLSNKVYACMSEDMDMLLYGCSRVIRQPCFYQHSAILYDIHALLNELNISQEDFLKMVILNGTDYNKPVMELYESYNLYLKYKEIKCSIHFYEWIIQEHRDYELNIDELAKTEKLFILTFENTNKLEISNYDNQVKDSEDLQKILQEAGFII